uniref:GATA-type domain-containing protein n=1 Tax=Kalanchoe fedtschenkoi TaxID=63787 RepID=A0A7N0V648_KALFE
MMTPMFLNPPNPQYFNLNQDHHQEDHQQQQVLLENSPFHPAIAASTTSLHLDQGLRMTATHSMSDQSPAFNDQLKASTNVFFHGESPSYGAQVISTDNYGSHNHDLFIFRQQADQDQHNFNVNEGVVTTDNNGSSLRWMSSKIRMMRKMINSNCPRTDPRGGSRIITSSTSPDHSPQLGIHSDNNHHSNVIRVCSDCNTTRTPLWRSGPQGPKTLCNACGIRQRKARKAAMEAAAAATNSSNEASSSTSTKTTIKLVINKDKKKSRATSNTCVSQHSNKKQAPWKQHQAINQLADSSHHSNRSTSSSSSKQQLRFEEFAVNLLSKNAAFHRMFPQDEEEGALLLMALSYGLIQS